MNNCALMEYGTGCWCAEVNGPALDDTVSVASSVSVMSEALSNGLKQLRIAWSLNNLSKKLSALLDGIYESCNKAEGGKAQKGSSHQVTKEQMESAIKALEYLYDVINRIYTRCEEKHLTNNSMMAASLRSIHRRAEELLDIADWLHMAIHSSASQLDAVYAGARAELAEGKTYDFSQVR